MVKLGKSRLVAIIAGAVVVVCAAFVLVLFLVKVLWAWTVPDLFPGAVKQGLVAESIGWLTAMKIALFVAVLSGLARSSFSHREERG
jgi:hypothetical protein